MQKVKPEKKFIDTDKGRIYYFSFHAKDNSVPVIFLHGLSSNSTTWTEIMKELMDRNIPSIALDMRGHGFSDKSRKRSWYKIREFTNDLNQIVQKEKLDKFILLGYSFSGAVALDYAINNTDKVERIILISANHVSPLKSKHLSLFNLIFYAVYTIVGWLMIWQKRKRYYYFDQNKSKGYWDSFRKGFCTMPISINLWMLSEMFRIDYSQKLSSIKCPVLLIRSTHDPFFSHKEMETMAGKFQECETITIDQTSHYLATAHQDKIRGAIVNFVKKTR